MAKKTATTPKAPAPVKAGKHVVIVEPGDELPKGVQLARWGSSGPGYHPGQCSHPHKGIVYVTVDFPHDIATGLLGRVGIVVK